MVQPVPPLVGKRVVVPNATCLLGRSWHESNVLTPRVEYVYCGEVLEVLEEAHPALLDQAARALGTRANSLTLVHRNCFQSLYQLSDKDAEYWLALPAVVDEKLPAERSRLEAIESSFRNIQALHDRNLQRFTPAPLQLLHLPLGERRVPVGVYASKGTVAPVALLQAGQARAELTAEVVAAIVYSYQPSTDGGTVAVDWSLGEGDFLKADESPALWSVAFRHLERNMDRNLLLSYLFCLVGYTPLEDPSCPVALSHAASNPSVALEGLRRGLLYRHQDGGTDDPRAAAENEFRHWVEGFARSVEGRAYADAIGLFLSGQLPLDIGQELREIEPELWPLEVQLDFLEHKLQEEQDEQEREALEAWHEVLSHQYDTLRRDDFIDDTARMDGEPYLHHPLTLPEGTQEAAVRAFPSFRDYMDTALFSPTCGLYSKRVALSEDGHFTTYPISLSPHFGRWLLKLAFSTWRSLVSENPGATSELFHLVEFGAGNGVLARDALRSLRTLALEDEDYRAFEAIFRYVIVERSAHLRREQQQNTSGFENVQVYEGDAREPEVALRQHFPQGLSGVVFSNELPDAFGVHKVMFRGSGKHEVALVVPRLSHSLLKKLPELEVQVNKVDKVLRSEFGLSGTDLYLNTDGFIAVLEAIATREQKTQPTLLDQLYFNEALVSAELFEDLQRHIRLHKEDYALNLKQGQSAALYVNCDADAFMQGSARLLHRGLHVTVDYGDTVQGLLQAALEGRASLRTYAEKGNRPLPNYPYVRPGFVDLTTDQNFTALARAGSAAGLELMHYGPQNHIVAGERSEFLAQLDLADADPTCVDFFSEGEGFMMLILGTGGVTCGVTEASLDTVGPDESPSGTARAAAR